MRSLRIVPAVSAALLLSVSAATALPASCDRVAEALRHDPDPARVAETLATTRARISACSKLTSNQQRQRDQRDELQRERAERGIE